MVKGRECSCRCTLPVGLCISFVLLFRGLKQSQLVRSQLQRPESKISYAGPRSRRGWGLSPPTPCPGPERISWPSPAPGGAVLSPSPSSGAASSLSRASGLPPSPGALYSTQAQRHHPWSRSSAPSSAKTFLHCIHAFQRPGRGVFGGCCPNHSRPAFQRNCRTLADGRKHFCTEACQPGSRSILKAPFCVPEGEIDHPQMTRPADQGWRGHVICGGTAPHRRLLAGRRGTGCHHPSLLVRLPCHKRDSQAPGPS